MSMDIKKAGKPKYEIVGELARFDEADNVQARGELEPDSELWRRYYEKHPELERQIRALSKFPGLGKVGPPQDLSMLAQIMGTIGILGRDEVVRLTWLKSCAGSLLARAAYEPSACGMANWVRRTARRQMTRFVQ